MLLKLGLKEKKMDNIKSTYRNHAGDRISTWTCILTDEEILALARGISPMFIRPDKLIYYAPLLNEDPSTNKIFTEEEQNESK